MDRLRAWWRWISGADTALSWAERVLRLFGVSASVGALSGLIAWVLQNPYFALVLGLAVWLAVLMGLLYQLAKKAERMPEEDSREQIAQEYDVDPGEAAPLTPRSNFRPPEGSERARISLPEMAHKKMLAIEKGKILVLKNSTFEDCDIHGPAILTLAEGSFEETFVNCEWGEGQEAFWPALKRPVRYIGVIDIQSCIFRRCRFKGIGVVIVPQPRRS